VLEVTGAEVVDVVDAQAAINNDNAARAVT
jgi:hypothetical protein